MNAERRAAARAEVLELRRKAHAAEAELAAREAELERARALGTEVERYGDAHGRAGNAARLEADARLQEAVRLREAAREQLAHAVAVLDRARCGLIRTVPDPADVYALLERETPLLLLPVRLETRFDLSNPAAPRLLVRIYPDDVHVDTHEPGLTADEAAWGRHFWKEVWRAAGDEAGRKRAWTQLAEQFGPERATWIARVLKPVGEPPAGDVPAEPPSFPDPPPRADSWTRAPRTRVLPDQWLAIGYRGEERVSFGWSAPIPDTLHVGPDPMAPAATTEDEAPVDEGMRWLTEFDVALETGMALELAVPVPAEAGFDRLVVLGVKASLDPEASASELGQLLMAHRYTRGFGFLPQGTPTNNTGDAAADYKGGLDPAARAYAAVLRPESAPEDDDSDGALTARALGLPARAFAGAEHAGGREQEDARHMNAVLWPATLGYFLDEMMAATFSPAFIEEVRRHFVDHVRARGPLPAWRVGAQPYGVLPVRSLVGRASFLAGGAPGSGELVDAPEQLAGLMRPLLDVWRRSLDRVPRVGDGRDPDETLLALLGTDGLSSTYAVRGALGRDYLTHLMALDGQSRDFVRGWLRYLHGAAYAALEELGLDWDPRLAWILFDPPRAFELTDAVVQEGAASPIAPPSPNVLRWMRTSKMARIRDEDFSGQHDDPGSPPDTLLYLLLRHSTLRAHVDAGGTLLVDEDEIGEAERHEQELLSIRPGTEAATPWHHLQLQVRGEGGALVSVAERLEELLTALDPRVRPLADLRAGLTHLEERPAAALERLLAETLDLCSHRLDAWVTSLASAELEQVRERRRSGVHLGGYGWLEDVRPGGGARSAGYIQAPSVVHGVTAAVLHSGYLSSERDAGSGPALDLSSARVRLAGDLLAGVRQGQPLGALLGYRFERALHERSRHDEGVELDRFIHPFRELAPLLAKQRKETDEPVEAIAADNVVDGLRLYRLWRDGGWRETGIPFPDGVAPPGDAERAALHAELDRLGDALAAVSDTLLAESVYHTAHGNPLRAGAALDAVAGGDVRPPELEFPRTPRTGTAVTHRILVLFPETVPEIDGWSVTPRARAEPRLDAWAARLLGPPDRVLCRAWYLKPEDREPIHPEPRTVSLSDLAVPGGGEPGLAPLDVLSLPDAADEEARTSELEQRLGWHLLRDRPEDVPERAGLRIAFERDPGWPTSVLSFHELLALARAAREAIGAARPMEPEDLMMPEDTAGGADSWAVEELKDRADAAAGTLHRVRKELDEAGAQAAARLDELKDEYDDGGLELAAALETLRLRLLDAASMGVDGAVPGEAVGSGRRPAQALLAQAKSAGAILTRRLETLKEREARLCPDSTPAAQWKHHLERLRAVFGAGFRAVPLVSPAHRGELAKTFAASEALQGGDLDAAVQWFQRTARVREPAVHLHELFLHAEALADHLLLGLEVGQLPHRDGDRWAGLAPEDGRLDGGRISLVAHLATGDGSVAGALEADRIGGLLVDEVVEVIPAAEETVAVAFHFDEPGARAPQAVLLAVPPPGDRRWTAVGLEQTVLHALDLARIRAVDPDALGALGQFLPALYFAVNADGGTVSTDFTRLAAGTAAEES